MPELRKDPVVGRWVIIATERARRPGNFIDHTPHESDERDCPFCNGEQREVYRVLDNDPAARRPWKVRVVESGTPILQKNTNHDNRGHGLYDILGGVGAHEVVLETPHHIANLADCNAEQIKLVIETYASRMRHHKKNSQFKYVFAYKNYGFEAGSRRIGHARSQIMATPVQPMRVEDKIVGAKRYFDRHRCCIFCDMIRQEQKSGERVVIENNSFIAITPFASRFPFELWILPKKHRCDFTEGVAGTEKDLASMLKELLLKIKIGINDPSYNYVIQTAPFLSEKATIEQDYHWHIEIMPRLTRVAGFEKGTGFYICSIPPEKTAEFLREVKI